MKKLLTVLTALSLYVGVCGSPAISADDAPKTTPEERYKKLDKNSDSQLNFDEFKGKQTDEEKLNAAKAKFEKADADKDMLLNVDEFKTTVRKAKDA